MQEMIREFSQKFAKDKPNDKIAQGLGDVAEYEASQENKKEAKEHEFLNWEQWLLFEELNP